MLFEAPSTVQSCDRDQEHDVGQGVASDASSREEWLGERVGRSATEWFVRRRRQTPSVRWCGKRWLLDEYEQIISQRGVVDTTS